MSFIHKIKPDFTSRGVAIPPPDLSGRSAPPPAPVPQGDGKRFDYNQKTILPFNPVYVKEVVAAPLIAAPTVELPRAPTSQFSPNTETYPTANTSYFLTSDAIAAAVAEWARYPAAQDVSMAGNSLLSTATVAAELITASQAVISSFGGYTNFEALGASSINANSINANSISSQTIVSASGNISTVTTRDIVLDGNILTTAGTNELLLNGIPIATTQNISSLADWSYDPAVSTVIMGANPISFGDAGAAIFGSVDGAIFISTIDDIFLEATTIRVKGVLDAPQIGNLSTVEGQATATVTLNNSGQGWTFKDYISVSTLQDVSTINGQPIGTSASTWATYPATQDVNLNSFSLNSTNQLNLNTGGNLTQLTAGSGNTLLVNGTPVGGGGNVSDWANFAAVSTINVNNQGLVSDNGLNITQTSRIDMLAQNGLQGAINLRAAAGAAGIGGGAINLTADGGSTLLDSGLFGAIRLTANPGTAAGVTTGGLISLTANSGGALANLTSAVKLTGGSVVSYAGVVSPIGSLFGYNYVYGTLGVSLAAGLPPGALQTPGTVYVYGTTGIVLNSDVYTTAIYPYWSGLGAPANLSINGRTTVDGSASVVLNNVATMSMEGSGAITGVQTINGTAYPPVFALPENLVVSTLTTGSTIFTSSLITSTINGLKPTNISTAAGVFSGTVRFAQDSNVYLFSDPTTNTLTYGLKENISSLNSIIMEAGGFISVPALSNVATINGAPYAALGANVTFSTVTIANQQTQGYTGGVGAPVSFQSQVSGATFYNLGIQNIDYSGAGGVNTVAMTNELLSFAPLAVSEMVVYGGNVTANNSTIGMTLSTDGTNFLVNGAPNWISTATTALNMTNKGITNISSITQVSSINGAAYPPPLSADITVSTLTTGQFISVPALSNVSSINGVAYPPSPIGKYGTTSGALALTGTFANMATMTFTTTRSAAPILSWGNLNVSDDVGGGDSTIEVRLLVNGTASLVLTKTLTTNHTEVVTILGNGTGPTPAGAFNVVIQARVTSGAATRISAQVSALSQFTLSA